MGIGAITPHAHAYLTATMTNAQDSLRIADSRADEFPLTTPFSCTITERANTETISVIGRSGGSGSFRISRGTPSYAFTTLAKLNYTGPVVRYPEDGGDIASSADVAAATAATTRQTEIELSEENLEVLWHFAEKGDRGGFFEYLSEIPGIRTR